MKEEIYPKKWLFSWSKSSPGMSLIEILIVIALVALLSVLMFAGFTRQMSRSRDAQRKDHLEDIRIAFEDYYNDNQCYPPLTALDECGSDELTPYLKEVPCDPLDRQEYVYSSLGGDVCTGYRVLVRLENTNDPNIESMGCDATNGCYYADPAYNFGIAMGDVLGSGDWEGGEGAWVIGSNGVCTFYSDELLDEGDCPTEYQTYEACFAVSGCTGNCSEDDVPLYLRCER